MVSRIKLIYREGENGAMSHDTFHGGGWKNKETLYSPRVFIIHEINFKKMLV